MAAEIPIEELVKRAASGDDQAVADLYTETSSHAYYLALQLVKDDDAAQDILQDAYVKALMNLNTLQDPSKFQSWLNSIVVNTGKNYLKKRQPILFSQMESNDDDNEPVDFADESEAFSPEAAVDYGETKRLVKEMIDRLPEQQRIAILLYYMEDYSVGQIADFMGCSDGTVKSRLNYGRRQIEKDVLELEKQGTKLYCAPLVPFLFWMFHTQVPAATISAAATATLTAGVATGAGVAAGAGTGAAVAGGTVTGAGVTAGTTAGASVITGATVGASAGAGSAVGATVSTGSTMGAYTAMGSTVGATTAAGTSINAATLSQMATAAVQNAASTGAVTAASTVGAGTAAATTIAAGTATSGTAVAAGTAAAATGLSLAAKIGIAAAVAVCIGGGAVAGVTIAGRTSEKSAEPAVVETKDAGHDTTGDREVKEEPVLPDIVYTYEQLSEEQLNMIDPMWAVIDACDENGYRPNDPELMWDAIYNFVSYKLANYSDSIEGITEQEDTDNSGGRHTYLVIPRQMIDDFAYLMFAGYSRDLPQPTDTYALESGMLKFPDEDHVMIGEETMAVRSRHYARTDSWTEHPDGTCTVILYDIFDYRGDIDQYGPYQVELSPNTNNGLGYAYIITDVQLITEAELAGANANDVSETEDTSLVSELIGYMMTEEKLPYKAILDAYSEDYYDLDLYYYAHDIIDTDYYYEFPDCVLEVIDYLDASLVEGKGVGDTVFVDGKERTINSIGEFRGNKSYDFDFYNDYDPDCMFLVETSYGIYVVGEDNWIHTKTVYEGPVRFSKDVVILGSDGTTVNDPREYFYEPREGYDGRQREHGYDQYNDEIWLYGDIEVDDKGYVTWYKERYTP